MSRVTRVLFTFAAIVVIVAGMRLGRSFLNPLLLAALLALSIDPLLGFLIRKGVPAGAALSVTIVAVILGGLGLMSALGASVANILQTLPSYEPKVMALVDEVQKLAAKLGLDLSQTFSLNVFNPQRIMDWTTTFLGGVLAGLSNFLVVILIVVFIMIESAGRHVAQRRGGVPATGVWGRVFGAGQEVRAYVGATALTGFMTAVANTILLLVLGVDFAFTWGIVSFLFNFVPNIGFVIALLPPVALALLEFGWQRALAVVAGYVLLNFIAENIVKPRLIRGGIDTSILEIFLSLLFWGFVLGPVGAVLSVPLTAVIKKEFAAVAAQERGEAPA